jgi:hypothetical protein
MTAIRPEFVSADQLDLQTVFRPVSALSVALPLPVGLVPKGARR